MPKPEHRSPSVMPAPKLPGPSGPREARQPGGPAHCGISDLPDDALAQVAAFFQLLAEPSRLRVLNLLRGPAQCVGDLARACGSSAANISRHLAQLQRHGLVHREGRGTNVYYRIADPSVYALCDLVCGQLARQHARAAEARDSFLKT